MQNFYFDHQEYNRNKKLYTLLTKLLTAFHWALGVNYLFTLLIWGLITTTLITKLVRVD